MLKGVSASPNIGIGRAFVYEKELKFKRRKLDEVETEIKRLDKVIEKSRGELKKLRNVALEKIGEKEAKIFEAQLLMLQDPALITEVKKKIIYFLSYLIFLISQLLIFSPSS